MKILQLLQVLKGNRKYYEYCHANEFDNLDEMDKYFEEHKLPNSFIKKQIT